MKNSAAVKWSVEKRPIIEFLSANRYFKALPQALLRRLAEICEPESYPPNQTILKEGNVNSKIFFILVGRVKVTIGGEVIANLGREGDVVGEMSVISQEPVSATIQAETPVELFTLNFELLREKLGDDSVVVENALFRIFAQILTRKLAITNDKAEKFEKAHRDLESTHSKLLRVTEVLESSVDERTKMLQIQAEQLQQRNQDLEKSQRKSEELLQAKDLSFAKLKSFYEQHLPTLQAQLGKLEKVGDEQLKSSIEMVVTEIEELMEMMAPVSEWGELGSGLKNKSVLFAHSDRKQQVFARLACASAVSNLQFATDEPTIDELIKNHTFDIICLESCFLHKVDQIRKLNPKADVVVMLSNDPQTSFSKILPMQNLSKIVSTTFEDRNFTIKNFHTTLNKIANHDYFGIKKYISAQSEVKKFKVKSSNERSAQIDQMAAHFKDVGIRASIIDRAKAVAEELLMNIIYDAPVDASGKSLYNHLPRTTQVTLNPHEWGELNYGCDGVLLAVSAVDPFGSLERDIILKYLESCYSGKAGTLNTKKGGAGRGLFMLVEHSDIVIFNVKKGVQTEVICLFSVDMTTASKAKAPSVHMFF